MKDQPLNDSNEDSGATKLVGGTVKTMEALEYLGRARGPVSAAEVARALQQNSSTTFNILRTLAQLGYLRIVAGSKLYVAGPALQKFAGLFAERDRIPEIARPLMQELAVKHDVMVTLLKKASPTSMVMLMIAHSESAIRIQTSIGIEVPLLQGGMGRLMVLQSGLQEPERQKLFQLAPQGRPISYRTFMAQAKLAEKRGWSLDDGNWHKSVTSISVPVRTGNEPLECVCTATMFRHQHAGQALENIASDLKNVALQLTRAISEVRQ